MPEAKPKAMGYTRVSTAEQASHGESLSTQRKEIEKYCSYRGLDLLQIVEDAGVSGKKETRPGLTKVIELAKAGAFEVLVATKISRLGRSARNFLNLYHDFKKLGIKLHVIAENITGADNATSRTWMSMLAIMAEWEHETIREQLFKNKMVRWKQQRIFPGRPPYGYRWNKETKRLEIVPDEAEIYRRIVGEYLDMGKSLRDIGVELEREGLRVRHGNFSESVLSYILRNPVYAGDYTVNRHSYVDGKRSKKLKAASEHIRFEVEPLVSRQTWERIQARLERNKSASRNAGPLRETFWLQDVLQCGECGGRMKPSWGNVRKSDGMPPRYYQCYWSRCSPKSLEISKHARCHLPIIKADDLEAVVWFKVMMRLTFWRNKSRLKSLLSAERWERELAQLDKKAAALKVKLARKGTARANLLRILERDLDEAEQTTFIERLQALEGEAVQLKNDALQIEGEILSTRNAMKQSANCAAYIENQGEALNRLADRIAALGPKERRLIVNAMADGDPIVVSGDRRDDKRAFVCSNHPGRINLTVLQAVLKPDGDDDPDGGGSDDKNGNGPDNFWYLVQLKRIYQTAPT